MRPRLISLLVLILHLLVSVPTQAWAAAGDLDPSFGQGGVAVVPVADTMIEDVSIAPGGKIVVAGTYEQPREHPTDPVRRDLFVARLLATGALDSAFSGNGWLTQSIGVIDEAHGVAVQPDGKVVVVGSTSGGVGIVEEFLVARFTSAGTLDRAFNFDGWDSPDGQFVDGGSFRDVVIGPDGSIYSVGTVVSTAGGFAIVKHTPTGSVAPYGDGEFGATVTFTGDQEEALAAALQPDGKLVVAGLSEVGSTNRYDFAVARLTDTGLLDTTFSGDGRVTTNVGPEDAARAVGVAPDGDVVVAGSRAHFSPFGAEDDFTAVRYTATGVPDSTFGGDGIVSEVFGAETSSAAEDLAVQLDGRVVIGGTWESPTDGDRDIALARLTLAGRLDRDFGRRGKSQTDLGGDETASSLVLQADGKVVVAGEAGGPAALRYLGDDATPPPSGPTVAVRDFAFDPARAKAPRGASVEWEFEGPSAHTATDDTGMGLFDSGSTQPGGRFSFAFVAAGSYAYRCSIHPPSTMPRARVAVPIGVSPSEGSETSTFKVRWASAAPPNGFVFDVQIRRPSDTRFTAWRTAVTARSASFVPDSGTGAYAFRARLRNPASAAAAGWSAGRSVSVV